MSVPATILAGMNESGDLAEIRAEMREFREQNIRLHNATRSDIADLRATVDDLRANVGDLRTKTSGGFSQAQVMFDALAAGQQQIVDLLTDALDNPR